MPEMGAGGFLLLLLEISLGVLALVFWYTMFKDNRKANEGYSRYMWSILIVVLPVLGAAVYFFTARKSRLAKEMAELEQDVNG